MRNFSRGFRLWEKKRGARRTGSRLAATVGEALFFGILFVLGLISLTILITSQTISPELPVPGPGFGFWLLILVSTSFVLIGGGGIFYTTLHGGASAERRSALVKQAAGIDLLRDALPSAHQFPTVPRDEILTDSPGVMLAYRLPVVKSTGWQLLAVTGLGLALTGFTTVLVVVAVQGLLLSQPDFFLIAFAALCAAASGWLIYYFLRRLWAHTRIGPTCVEISDLPLRPGGKYEIFLSQGGRLVLRSLEMFLICEEEATYRQGTDIRTESQVVYEESVLRRTKVRVEPGAPLEVAGRLKVPGDAMHNFKSGHNAVRWKLVVQVEPASWPEFERVFPLLVYPVKGKGGTSRAETFRKTDGAQAPGRAADQSADPES